MIMHKEKKFLRIKKLHTLDTLDYTLEATENCPQLMVMMGIPGIKKVLTCLFLYVQKHVSSIVSHVVCP